MLQNPINYETASIAIPELYGHPAHGTRTTFLQSLLGSTCNHRPTHTFKYFTKEHARIAIGASTTFIKTPGIAGAIELPLSEEDSSEASTEINDSASPSEPSSDNRSNTDSDKENKLPTTGMTGSRLTSSWRMPMLDPGINPMQRRILSPVYRPLSPPDLSDEENLAHMLPQTPPQQRSEVMVYEDGAEFGPFQILASDESPQRTQLVTFVFHVVSLRALPSTADDSIEIGWVVDDPSITIDHVDHVLVAFTGRPGKYALVNKEDFQPDHAGALNRMTPEEVFLRGKKEDLVVRLMGCSILPERLVEEIAREAEGGIMMERAEMQWMYEHVDEVIAKQEVGWSTQL